MKGEGNSNPATDRDQPTTMSNPRSSDLNGALLDQLLLPAVQRQCGLLRLGLRSHAFCQLPRGVGQGDLSGQEPALRNHGGSASRLEIHSLNARVLLLAPTPEGVTM